VSLSPSTGGFLLQSVDEQVLFIRAVVRHQIVGLAWAAFANCLSDGEIAS
jgi:hypothetical protein